MVFQPPLTIVDVINGIRKGDYVLPAIQREFVWSPSQIATLFDSLMRGYPIGSFLFWKLDKKTLKNHSFFEFIAEYDVRTPHNEVADVEEKHAITAVLDGQQRLTAFNIALRGGYTEKVPRLQRSNPKAFQKRFLQLNILERNHEASPDERVYDFAFLTDAEADAASGHWVRVDRVLKFDPESTDVYDYIHAAGLAGTKVAYNNLYRLTQLVHKTPTVSAFHEQEDDLDKVLNIFIRVNSGGTKLSYADLILSVATATWTDASAREEVSNLVDEMNQIGQGFSFSKDRILKSALVLGDFTDIKFKAMNFTSGRMLKVEEEWASLSSSLKIATSLLAQFGLSGDTLTAENVLIPVAYYVNDRGLGMQYLTSDKCYEDRELVKKWVLQTLLRAGFWTGAVDSILTIARDVMKGSQGGFPFDDLESALRVKGKSLRFAEAEVEDLLRLQYRNRSSFLVLTQLYPHVDVSELHHKDHIFPRARFTRAALTKAGVSPGDVELFRELAEQLPNLQLLRGLPNQEKSKVLPHQWLAVMPPNQRDQYVQQNDLGDLPRNILDFPKFFETRKGILKARLMSLLKIQQDDLVAKATSS